MLKAGKDLVQVARVLKSNGTDGEMVLGLHGIDSEELNLREPVFIYFDGSPVPFFVETIAQRGQRRILVRLTGIHSAGDVEEIVGEDVYVEPSSLPSEDEGEEDYDFLVGWTLYDGEVSEETLVGEIIDFADIPSNPCIDVETKNGEVMIPLHQDLIEYLDEESQIIVMDIPAGLI